MGATGQVVTLKDLHNIAAEDTAKAGDMSVEAVTDFLQSQPGIHMKCIVHLRAYI